jgi:PAS domain S-box-containing protein
MAGVGTDVSMEAILDCIAQPVWVVDHEGAIVYVNPAGVAALGYDDLDEIQGRPGHETVHYKHADGSPFPASECPMSRSRETGASVRCDEDWFVRRDGSMFPVSYVSTPLDMPGGPGLVVAFTDIAEKRRAEQAARERDVAEARAAELRAARRRIIDAADAARAQLGRDLHDGAQQQFVVSLLNLQMAERKLADDPETARALHAQGVEMARAGLAELRRLASGLHPALLSEGGLGHALQALGRRLPLPVEVVDGTGDRLPERVETGVFFLVSEALTNVVKHAHASRASIRLAADDGHLAVEVADDGVGGAAAAGGSGLRGLADRVAALDGTFGIDSPPGRGTALRARIPLKTTDSTTAAPG